MWNMNMKMANSSSGTFTAEKTTCMIRSSPNPPKLPIAAPYIIPKTITSVTSVASVDQGRDELVVQRRCRSTSSARRSSEVIVVLSRHQLRDDVAYRLKEVGLA